MPERNGHANHRLVAKVIGVSVLITAVLLFAFGCGYNKLFTIDNYNDFMQNLTQYSDEDSGDIPEKPTPPQSNTTNDPDEPDDSDFMQIRGFEPLIKNTFNIGKKFSGGYAFAKVNDKNYLVDSTGNYEEITEDLSNYDISGMIYVTHTTQSYGVCTIFGKQIVDEVYDRIEIYHSTVLAISDNIATIYRDNKELSSCEFKNSISLLDDSYILKDGVIFDLYFNEMTVGGHVYKDLPSDGIVTVDIGDGYFGYADLKTQKVIAGPFVAANRFICGYASAQMSDGSFVVMDISGTIVYSSDTRVIGVNSGNYFCFLQNNLYGVMDKNFQEIVKPMFTKVIGEKTMGDYLLASHGSGISIYSLLERTFVSDIYDTITYVDNLFICKVGDKYVVLNDELSVIIECEYATYSEGILLIKIGGKYSYYKRCING